MGYGMLPPNGADNRLPTVTYISNEYEKKGTRYGARTIHVQGTKHGHFEDAMRRRIRLPGSVDPIEVHEVLAESMAGFMKSRGCVDEEVLVKGTLFRVVR
mmetsp:Transcript_56109/g.67639  ORF Transcript_56109/g.67639 Transcript_56109/m.67639 type:complete len:100 (+) Transcript_56109:3-302(+)